MQKITGTVVKAGSIALALALAGCGGGGGSAPDAPPGAPPTAQRDVQGTAAKGLIKGGKVSIHALDAQGGRASTALAAATTASDGTYKLQVPVSVRNFVIEVGAAPGAVMADETTGTDIALAESMKLRSVVTLAENATGTYQGSVSPLTEMVARTAETADGKLPPQAVAQAKTHVRTLLGFDPETVKPVNSNSPEAAGASEEEKNQSLVLAAISKMASTASADCGQSNAGERIACVVSKLAASVTVKDGQPTLEQNRLAQLRDAIQAVAQDKNINRTGKDKVVGMPVLAPPPGTPEPPVGTSPTPLAATKALFGSLRSNLHALGEGDAFRATAESIKADLDGNLVPFSNNLTGFASLAMDAIDRLNRYRSGEIAHVDFTVMDSRVMDGLPKFASIRFGRGEGTCLITKSPLSISCTVIQEILSYPSTTPNKMSYATRTFTLQPKPGSMHDFAYSAVVEKNVVLYDGWTTTGLPTRESLGATFAGEISFARSGATVTQFAVRGSMPGRMERGSFLSDGEDWVLDVMRTEEEGGLALYTFGGSVTEIDGQSTRKVEIDDTSFLRVALQGTNNSVLPHAANELQLTLRGIVGDTTVGGTVRMSGDKLDKSKTSRMATELSFEGSLEHKDRTVFSGQVALTRNGYENFDASAAESGTNFIADTIEIGGALSLPNRPTLSLTVGATRTALDAGAISAQYRDGTSVINASVTARAGERHPRVSVASAEGVAFSFTSTSAPLQVTKDGAVTAQVDLVKGIITYSDGSTESLI